MRTVALVASALSGPYTPDPDDPRIFFLDIWAGNDVDLDVMARFRDPEVRGLMIRIGGSAAVKDEKFQVFWPWAKEAGFLRDIYTYNYPGYSVDSHIRNFMDAIDQWAGGDLGDGPIWLDAELHANLSRRVVTDHIRLYREALIRETGKEVGIYTGKWFIDGYMEFQDWMDEALWWMATWVAGGSREHSGPPSIPFWMPRKNVVWHQTGSNCDGRLFGGAKRVDTDRWERSEAEFRALYNTEPPYPPDLEQRVAYLETAVEELQARVAALDEWASSYGSL